MPFLSNFEPSQLLLFVLGAVLAVMVTRLATGARRKKEQRFQPRAMPVWLQAAVAFALLIGLWIYLR